MADPITPPPELLEHWEDQHYEEGENYDVMLIQAYQAGADQELEACCEWLVEGAWFSPTGDCLKGLRAARRPQPPSLKEQALEQLACIQTDLNKFGMGISTNTIRRALEALDD
jgi:hypothetical protein